MFPLTFQFSNPLKFLCLSPALPALRSLGEGGSSIEGVEGAEIQPRLTESLKRVGGSLKRSLGMVIINMNHYKLNTEPRL